jgi:hypothetical protein
LLCSFRLWIKFASAYATAFCFLFRLPFARPTAAAAAAASLLGRHYKESAASGIAAFDNVFVAAAAENAGSGGALITVIRQLDRRQLNHPQLDQNLLHQTATRPKDNRT